MNIDRCNHNPRRGGGTALPTNVTFVLV